MAVAPAVAVAVAVAVTVAGAVALAMDKWPWMAWTGAAWRRLVSVDLGERCLTWYRLKTLLV